MSTIDSEAETASLGRYHLVRLMTSDVDSAWWQAREVAAERDWLLQVWLHPPLPRLTPATWREATRAQCALSHPNIVHAVEARIEADRAVLVCAPLAGVALSQWLADHETMPVRQAVLVAIGVLDALSHAHAAGVVHGHVRPDAVWLDITGRALLGAFEPDGRVIDPTRQATARGLYLAPEVAAGRRADPRSDVYAVGLLLYELLVGRAAVADPQPRRALEMLQVQELRLPQRILDQPAEAGLRAIVHSALARDPLQRPDSAQALRQALQDWLTPALLDGSGDTLAQRTVQRLLLSLAHHGDLPVQAEAVRRVRRLAGAERVNLDEIARAVLDDAALAHKLLRMTNAAYFSSVGGGSITTVSRSIALLGFEALRDLAGTLPQLEDLRDSALREALADEYARCRVAGRIAARLCPTQAEEEESYIAALMQNLGRVLVQHHLPDEAAQVRQLARSQGQSEEQAARAVLGLTFEDLGVAVGRSWGLPEELLRVMRAPRPGTPVRAPERRGDWFRLLGGVGNVVAGTRTRDAAREIPAETVHWLDQYAAALGLQTQQVWDAAGTAAPPVALARRSPAARPARAGAIPAAGASPTHPLSQAILDMRTALLRREGRDTCLDIAGQAVLRHLGCRRVVLVELEPASGWFLARRVWGEGGASLSAHFRFARDDAADAFSALCAKGADSLIRDATVPGLAAKLPAWFRTHVAAPAFMLLPISDGRHTAAALYADHAQPDGFKLSDRDLSLMRSLRDELRKLYAALQPLGA
ncbi:MAG: serine/threonine-protein kinase [Caldimonas sp.]|uniref:serine/threonine-protein kinase n=1 Tax=Caldimonas sp. TaxID=2838790 RepID=UPI00391C707C